MKIRLFMKTYNEVELIRPWLEYHTANFAGMITIIDHHSDRPEVLEAYDDYRNEIDIIKIPRSQSADSIHHPHMTPEYWEMIRTYDRVAILDNDNFLVEYRDGKIRPFVDLDALEKREKLSFGYIPNLPARGEPKHLDRFRLPQTEHEGCKLLNKGKSFFDPNSRLGKSTCHGFQIPGMFYSSRHFTLHLNSRLSDEGRIRSAKAFIEQRGEIEMDWSDEKILGAIQNIPQEKIRGYHKLLVSHILGTDEKKSGRRAPQVMTNVLRHVIDGEDLTFEMSNVKKGQELPDLFREPAKTLNER